MPPLTGHGPQCRSRCRHVRRSCRASLALHRPRGGPRSAVGPCCPTPPVTAPRNAQPCLIQKPSCCWGGLEDALGGWSPRMLCSRRMLCCQKMLSGDAVLFKDALGGCSSGDALFSEDWEKRAAEDALAHTGRAPWLTEVSHLASAHKHPRKVPWMEEGNLRGPHGGSDGEEDPKERFATGNGGCSQGDASFCQVSG